MNIKKKQIINAVLKSQTHKKEKKKKKKDKRRFRKNQILNKSILMFKKFLPRL